MLLRKSKVNELHSTHSSRAAMNHKHLSPKKLKIALFTVSSSRFRDDRLPNQSGEIAIKACMGAGHECTHEIIDDDKLMIRISLLKAFYEKKNDAVIFLGGTGLSPRDVTMESVAPLLDKQIDGFGEIFRKLSYDSIGTPAIMSRALAGTMEGKPIFCLPGSPDAAELGMNLTLKELPHVVFIAHNNQ